MTLPHVSRGTTIEADEQNQLIDQVNQNTLAIAQGGGGGGVTDHGFLAGLTDDDHPQYLTQPRADLRYYTETEVDASLAAKANSTHAHAQSDVTGLSTTLTGKANATHAHAQADVTGLSTALTGKANTVHTHSYAPVSHSHAESDVTGLTSDLASKASLDHTHGIDDLTATGTRDDTTFLRGDGTWTQPPTGSGGGGVTDHGALTGLADDDHPQYLTQTRADARYYTETETDAALAAKSDTVHTHTVANVTGLQSELDGKSPTTHVHDDRYFTETEVTTALSGKSDTAHTHSYDPAGTAATAVSNHAAAVDPHPQYVPSADINDLVVLTQAEYDALTPDPTTMYIIPDGAVAVLALTLNGAGSAINANLYNSVNITLAGDGTLNVPTGGSDHQSIQVVAYASGALRTLTFAAGFERLAGIDASYPIPSGKKLRVSMRRSTLGTSGWIIEAAAVTV